MTCQSATGFPQTADAPGTAVVFQLWAEDAGIFLEKETYARCRLIQLAIDTAETWHDLEQLLPGGEFQRLGTWRSCGGKHIYQDRAGYRFIAPDELDEFWNVFGRAYLVRSTDAFDPDLIAAAEGDYRGWLIDTAENILPREFVARFGTGAGSAATGCRFEYRLSDLVEMVEALGANGFSVTAQLSYDFSWWRQIHPASR